MKQMVNGECQVFFSLSRENKKQMKTVQEIVQKSAISLTLSIAQQDERRRIGLEKFQVKR